MTVVHHQCKGFLKVLIPEDTVTIDMEVMTLKGIHIFQAGQALQCKKTLFLGDHNKPPSSFLKRLRDTQGTPSKEFLEIVRNLDENFRPKTPCKCPKVAKMSDREVIMNAKQRRMDKVTETQARPPAWNPIPSDWSDDEDENDKDDQARAPIAKPILQDPQPSTSSSTYPNEILSSSTYPNETLPKVVTFG